MNKGLVELLDRGRGILSWEDAEPHALQRAVRAGQLVRLFPRVYVDSALYAGPGQGSLLRRAAMRYVGARGAISHTTALDLWDLHEQLPAEPIHVTVASETRLRSSKILVVHRRADFEATVRTWRHGLLVVSAAEAVVGSWPLVSAADRRKAVIDAVGRRLATPAKMRQAMARMPKLEGSRDLKKLVDLLASGCHSPLEIWGALRIFTGQDAGL